eukprot:757458-Hanusia_phi.AAC.9
MFLLLAAYQQCLSRSASYGLVESDHLPASLRSLRTLLTAATPASTLYVCPAHVGFTRRKRKDRSPSLPHARLAL